MTTQAHLFGAAGRTDDDQTLAELEVDYTPPAVAVQALLALRDHGFLGDDCRRVLDPAAGSGCWGGPPGLSSAPSRTWSALSRACARRGT